MIDTRLALPQRSPMPLSVPWIWRTPGQHRGERIGDGLFGVVMGVDADMIAGNFLHHLRDDFLDLVWQRAAVGVAQHHPARARLVSGPARRRAHMSVWPCSRRKNARNRPAPRDPRSRRLHDAAIDSRFSALRRTECDAHMEVPCLRNEAHCIRLGIEKRCKPRIVGGRAAWPLGHAESRENGAELAPLQRTAPCRSDWRRDIRPRCSRYRVRRACSDATSLSSQREIDAVRLRAVAQCRIEQIEPFARHGDHQR